MQPTAVPHLCAWSRLARPEKDRAGKDPAEAVSQAAVVRSVLGKAPLVENLTGTFKLHGAGLLADGLGCDPQGNETVLTEGHAVVRVADDLQEEPSVASGIPERSVRQTPDRQPA